MRGGSGGESGARGRDGGDEWDVVHRPGLRGMAFRLEAVVFGAAEGKTQTVALVQGTITNQVGVKVVSATDRMLVVTNAPWLFQGDGVRITTSATNAFPVVGTGVTGD